MGKDDHPAYEKYMLGGDTYEARNPMIFNPDRIVFLDGVVQSVRKGNAAYHEALVHPVMFSFTLIRSAWLSLEAEKVQHFVKCSSTTLLIP